MRVDSDSGRPTAEPLPAPSPPVPGVASAPQRPRAGPSPAPVAIARDRIDESQSTSANRSDGVSALADWAKDEWSTVASAAHGMATIPGVVAQSWQDAAKTNTHLATTIRATDDHWATDAASVRQKAIDGLEKAAAPVSKTATAVAHDLGQANRYPLTVEKSIDAAQRRLPPGVKHVVKYVTTARNSDRLKLPAQVEARARTAAEALDVAAAAQAAKASTTVSSVSALIGKTVGQLHGDLGGKSGQAKLLAKIPALANTPVFGVGLTAIAIANDVKGGKSLADAAVANIGGTLAGTAVGSAVTEGLTASVDAAAIADGAAAGLGAAAAAGPVGWAVAGGVVAGVAVGYGVYKVVESKPGQDVIDGVTRLDSNKVGQGLAEARSDVLDLGAQTGRWISSSVHRMSQ
jgi:hypothetical protein